MHREVDRGRPSATQRPRSSPHPCRGRSSRMPGATRRRNATRLGSCSGGVTPTSVIGIRSPWPVAFSTASFLVQNVRNAWRSVGERLLVDRAHRRTDLLVISARPGGDRLDVHPDRTLPRQRDCDDVAGMRHRQVHVAINDSRSPVRLAALVARAIDHDGCCRNTERLAGCGSEKHSAQHEPCAVGGEAIPRRPDRSCSLSKSSPHRRPASRDGRGRRCIARGRRSIGPPWRLVAIEQVHQHLGEPWRVLRIEHRVVVAGHLGDVEVRR